MLFKNYDRVVFAGDSVTDMGSNKPVGEGLLDSLGFGYVRVIENMLAAWYPELIIRITNSGVSGNTSRDLLERFDRDVVDLNPDWVSICIGINDVWRQVDLPAMTEMHVLPSEYEENVEKMILKIKDKVKGIFIATPYIMEPNLGDEMRKIINDYIAICKKLSEKYNCTYIDFQEMYDEYCKFQYSATISWDRIHPNQKGATLMAKTFLKKCGFDFEK